jgi:predicted Rossmann fold nucleotide-binding protein DprA/Smf involved in DNA uptake
LSRLKNLDQQYLLGLSLIQGLGPVRIKLLLDQLSSPEDIWRLPERQVMAFKLPTSVKESFLDLRKKIDPAGELEKLARAGYSLLTISDTNYPKLLKEIYDPPTVLYVKGNFSPNSSKILGSLTIEPTHIDDLVKGTHLPVSELGSALTVMILAGKVTELSGGFYARKH